jgi:hypothetical protein
MLHRATQKPGTIRMGFWDLGESRAPGTDCAGSGDEGVPQGTRASANTSGPDFTWGFEAR